MSTRIYPEEPLDQAAAALHIDEQYPLVFLHLELAGDIEHGRFVKAMELLSCAFPQLSCAYDMKRNQWYDVGIDPRDMVVYMKLAEGPRAILDGGCIDGVAHMCDGDLSRRGYRQNP